MTPKLTIGMAAYDDFDGVYFTIQSLRLYHADVMKDVEFAVIDNNSGSPSGKAVRDFMSWVRGDVAAAHYVPFTGVTGTAAPRNHLFSVGTAPVVMCIDPHILLVPGSIRRLIDHFDSLEGSYSNRDLYHGPLVYDDLRGISTHFRDTWGSDQMWGEWGTDLRGIDPDGEPFEIPGQGLGLFVCRRDAWLGFNPRFRGFGGEEMYIHEKFRKAGRKVWCLPFLRWVHRFGRPNGVRYPLDIWDKARNYVLGLTELGIPLDRARASFVDTGRIKADDWDRLVRDPDYKPIAPGCNLNSAPAQAVKTLEQLYKIAAEAASDINEHVPTLRSLASQCQHVTEFGVRTGVSTTGLLAGQPQRLVSIDLNESPQARGLSAVKGKTDFRFMLGDSTQVEIEETDLLFIDTKHTGSHLAAELAKHHGKVRKWIAFHDTTIFGVKGEDNQDGLLIALRDFCRERKEWAVIRHDMNNHGFTVISRIAAEHPKPAMQPWPLDHGPGTELKALIASLGINPSPSCDCNAKAEQMNVWGVEGCKQRREEIVQGLRDNAPRWGWKDKLKAAALATVKGIAFKLDLSDPYGSLVDLAIRQAEEKEKANAA